MVVKLKQSSKCGFGVRPVVLERNSMKLGVEW